MPESPRSVRDSFGTIDNLYKQGKEITGLATHFNEFDRMTSGLQHSELTIIAARPSMGKTAWAINIAQNAAVYSGKVVAVFSLEMSKESLLRRMLASQALVDSQKIQKGFLLREDQEKLTIALEALTEAKIFIDDTPGISLTEMRAKARRLKQMQGSLDLIVIDYLQLMSASQGGKASKGYENRTQEVSAISRGLKGIGERTEGSRRRALPAKPRLRAARRGQEADALRPSRIRLDRAGRRRPSPLSIEKVITTRDENGQPDPATEGKAEIIIAKQRNGPTGSVHLAYMAKCTRFRKPSARR